uniref:DDE Tnp4 domain-containing protein n=1 Tax=Brassica oleracea var. oleracea TaxID=109376 RepID=A0A0D3ARM6_BRAOL
MASSSSQNTFDDTFDDTFDELFDQAFENFQIQDDQEERRKKEKKRVYIERHRGEAHNRLWNDYFSETPTYPHNLFRRRFRMNKSLFMHIVDRFSNEVQYFRETKDGLSPLQKCTAAIRVLAYGSAADSVDEYLRLEYRGFPGMIGSIDCMHWKWKNCPTAWKGQYARVFDDIINGQAPKVTFSVNGHQYNMAYYLTDERAFGVLQARFGIVKNPARSWDKVKIGNIMRACIILHNMIVENERDEYTQFNVQGFQQGEDQRSSHVDLMYSTDIPSNIANMMGVRTIICDTQRHQQLKDDLVEHIWRRFGGDEDNN